MKVRTWLFFATLAGARLFRFSLEGYLAARFGRRILSWLNSDLVQNLVFACIVLGVGLTGWTLWKFFRGARRVGLTALHEGLRRVQESVRVNPAAASRWEPCARYLLSWHAV